ncbi:MAG: hypothetical protein ACFFBP_04555 [Promethearchaeota archaeon]
MKYKINIAENKSEIITIILLLLLSLITLVRPFFYADADIHDSVRYALMVEFFRGNVSIDTINYFWRTNPLVTFLASLLPFEAMLSMDIISLIFHLLSVFFFYKFLQNLEVNHKLHILGTLIYIFSAPTIVLGFTPLTDSAGMFFVIFTLYLHEKLDKTPRNSILIGITIAVGIIARDTLLVMIPIFIIWKIIDEGIHWKDLILYIIYISLIPLLTYLILKILVDFQFLFNTITFNIPDIIKNFEDLREERTLATIAQLTLILLTGLYANLSKIFKFSKQIWKLLIGMSLFLIPWIYAFIYADMSFRFFWQFFVFAIPLLILGIQEFNRNSKEAIE